MLAGMRKRGMLVVESEDQGPDWVMHAFESMPRGVDFTHQVVSPNGKESYMFKSEAEAREFMNVQRELSATERI